MDFSSLTDVLAILVQRELHSPILLAGEPDLNLIYILLWILGLTVFIQSILLIFLWRRWLSIVKQGSAAVGRIVGEIRKTFVGGSKRGKPLASLRVLDGPPNMVGQELKIYTESVKLGRNPQLADMTFYGPDVMTSISSLHSRVERVNGAWRIVALSQSGSETFIDDQPIPFHEPVLIQSGQKIRMGYFAQQPVILEFQTERTDIRATYSNPDDDRRRTEVASNDDFVPKKPISRDDFIMAKDMSSEDSDSVFDEFR